MFDSYKTNAVLRFAYQMLKQYFMLDTTMNTNKDSCSIQK